MANVLSYNFGVVEGRSLISELFSGRFLFPSEVDRRVVWLSICGWDVDGISELKVALVPYKKGNLGQI